MSALLLPSVEMSSEEESSPWSERAVCSDAGFGGQPRSEEGWRRGGAGGQLRAVRLAGPVAATGSGGAAALTKAPPPPGRRLALLPHRGMPRPSGPLGGLQKRVEPATSLARPAWSRRSCQTRNRRRKGGGAGCASGLRLWCLKRRKRGGASTNPRADERRNSYEPCQHRRPGDLA